MYTRSFALLLALLVGACAAPMQMTPRQQSEAAFEAAKKEEAGKKSEEMKAKAAATAAETARRAAGKSFAAVIQAEAAAAEARLAAIKAEADAQRRRACELDPDLCPKAAQPPPAPPPPLAQPAPPPPLPDQFVDVEIDQDWSVPRRISPYPSGWELVFFGGDKDDTLILRINGVVKSSLKKGAALGCWRFRELAVERCPVR